jgi:hypothetical protein
VKLLLAASLLLSPLRLFSFIVGWPVPRISLLLVLYITS